MTLIDKSTLQAMADAGIEFVGNIPAPGGNASLALDPGEVGAFVADPAAYFALRHGASKEEYRQWVETEGTPRCGALTKSGTRCQNVVSGGIHMPFETWLQEDGGFCVIHGGAPGRRR